MARGERHEFDQAGTRHQRESAHVPLPAGFRLHAQVRRQDRQVDPRHVWYGGMSFSMVDEHGPAFVALLVADQFWKRQVTRLGVVGLGMQQQGRASTTVTPGATDFLVIAVQRIWQRGMKDGAHIALIDAQAERGCRHHAVKLVCTPLLQKPIALGCRGLASEFVHAAQADLA